VYDVADPDGITMSILLIVTGVTRAWPLTWMGWIHKSVAEKSYWWLPDTSDPRHFGTSAKCLEDTSALVHGHFGTTVERWWDSAPAVTWRITDFSYPRPFFPKNERSLWRTFVPQERKFQELSFPGPFVPGNFSSPGTKVPWNFPSQAFSFSGTFVPGERKFQGTFVPGTFRTRELSFPLSDIGLVAALLCVLNYCMFGCDFTLMMLIPLWTSQLTLYVGRAAFAARLSVFDVRITVSLHTKRLS